MVWKEKSSKFIFIHVFIFGNDGGKVDVGSSGTWDIDLPCAQFPRVIRGNEPGCKASGNKDCNSGILTEAMTTFELIQIAIVRKGFKKAVSGLSAITS